MHINKGIKLQFAISLLVIITLLSTVIVGWYTSTKALRSTLTDNYLENNYKYAYKLSLTAGDILTYAQQNITALGEILGDNSFEQEQLDNWRTANNNYFNSLFIVDSKGVVQLISPSVVQFNKKVQSGMKIQSDTMTHALLTKQPFISEPYIATSGQLIMMISAPIFDDSGNFKGLVAGTIYLESGENIFNHLLNDYENTDGSFVYVVDRSGRIIYHPDRSRINDDVSENEAVQQVLQRKNGAAQIINTEGNEFIAGYAYEKYTGWGIVSQTPISVLEAPLADLSKKMIVWSIPLLLLILLMAGILASYLSKPLNKLAQFSENAIQQHNTLISISSLKVKSPIYEVHQLYYHIYKHFKLLNKQIQLDGLTELANRRTFDITINEFIHSNIPFTLVMLDIDYFKKVNDTCGHLVGDDVLKFLSNMINEHCDVGDLCFRYGGEEFGILLKDKNVEEAFDIAEKLRIKAATTQSPTGKPITMSLGISCFQEDDQYPETIIKRADAALFKSKADGRNRTTVYNETCDSALA